MKQKTIVIPKNFKILSSILENETGFNLEIVKTPFDDKLDLSVEVEDEEDNDDVFILDDEDAAKHIVCSYFTKQRRKNVSYILYLSCVNGKI